MKIIRVFRSSGIVGLGHVLLLLGVCSTGCAQTSAPATAPVTVTATDNAGAKCVVVDGAGMPLQQVKIQIDQEHESWNQPIGMMIGDHNTKVHSEKVVDGKFVFVPGDSSAVTLTFNKDGYYTRVFGFSGGKVYVESIAEPGEGHDVIYGSGDDNLRILEADPKIKPDQVRVVMQSIGPVVKLAECYAMFYDPPAHAVPPASLPPLSCLTIVAKRDAGGNVATADGPAPGSPKLIAGLTLRFTGGATGGMLRYIPKTIYPLREMREAPEAGYQHEIVLSTADIRGLIFNRAYFYILANGKYGKMWVEIMTPALLAQASQPKTAGATAMMYISLSDGRNLVDGKSQLEQ